MQSHWKSGTTFWTPERGNFYLMYLLPFQWIFESIVDDVFAWNNFPCWNEICQLDQYGYHKWMGLNIICYLQHPNQTYIPMSVRHSGSRLGSNTVQFTFELLQETKPACIGLKLQTGQTSLIQFLILKEIFSFSF